MIVGGRDTRNGSCERGFCPAGPARKNRFQSLPARCPRCLRRLRLPTGNCREFQWSLGGSHLSRSRQAPARKKESLREKFISGSRAISQDGFSVTAANLAVLSSKLAAGIGETRPEGGILSACNPLSMARRPENCCDRRICRLDRGSEPLTSRPVLGIFRRFHKSRVSRVLYAGTLRSGPHAG
jgi:hypothetical protein